MENRVPMRRGRVFTEPFTCKVTPEVKQLELELKARGADVPEITREALSQAFKKSLESLKTEAS